MNAKRIRAQMNGIPHQSLLTDITSLRPARSASSNGGPLKSEMRLGLFVQDDFSHSTNRPSLKECGTNPLNDRGKLAVMASLARVHDTTEREPGDYP
jgi:hypothetical protein